MAKTLAKALEVILIPLVFALYPIAFLAAHNIHEIDLSSTTRAVAIAVGAVPALVLLARVITRDSYRAALIVLMLVVLFFSYGHVRDLMKSMAVTALILGRHRYLAVLFTAIWVGWSGMVLRRTRSPDTLARGMGLVGVGLMVMPMFTIVASVFPSAWAARQAALGRPAGTVEAAGTLPDVYYIILDGYGRNDVLQELYGFDNVAFLGALKARGFYVADDSLANYNTTRHSLASSLNLDYLQSIEASVEMDVGDALMEEMIWQSTVRRRLESLGYETVAFESGRPWSSITDVDHYFAPGEEPKANAWMSRTTFLNEFETILVESTFLSLLLDSTQVLEAFEESQSAVANEEHRIRVIYGLEKLQEIPRWPVKTFTFLHVLSPHPPFLFGASGERIDHDRPFTFGDGNNFLEIAGREDYIEGYVAQVQFLNGLVLAAVDGLLAVSDPLPVIVIQGDHGPGAYLNWQSMEDSNLRERLGILNAYFLPGEAARRVYPSISPVNSFRVILDAYFGGDYPLLEDRSFFTEKNGAYELVEVTDQVGHIP